MIGSLVDRLRGVLARDVDPESPDDRGLRERSGGPAGPCGVVDVRANVAAVVIPSQPSA